MPLTQPLRTLATCLILVLGTCILPLRPAQADAYTDTATYSFSYIDNRVITVNGEPVAEGEEFSGADLMEVSAVWGGPGGYALTRTENGVSESVYDSGVTDVQSIYDGWQAIWTGWYYTPPEQAIWTGWQSMAYGTPATAPSGQASDPDEQTLDPGSQTIGTGHSGYSGSWNSGPLQPRIRPSGGYSINQAIWTGW